MAQLQDLYLDELKDALSFEGQIIKALPKMAKKATSPKLKAAFEKHLEETKTQVERLNQIFENLGEKAKPKMCDGMKGIIEEGKSFMEEAETDELMDAGLIASAQRVEHYEIAGYGTLRTYAQILGDNFAVKLLQKSLDEETKTDKSLTALAESGINIEAVNAEAK